MSLSTTLTFPCGFSQQETNENNLESILWKAQCRRHVHTLSSDTLTIEVSLKFLYQWGIRLFTGTTQIWCQMFVKQPTKLKIEDRHVQTTGTLPYWIKCRERGFIRKEYEKLSIKEITHIPWASSDQGVRPVKCPILLTTGITGWLMNTFKRRKVVYCRVV